MEQARIDRLVALAHKILRLHERRKALDRELEKIERSMRSATEDLAPASETHNSPPALTPTLAAVARCIPLGEPRGLADVVATLSQTRPGPKTRSREAVRQHLVNLQRLGVVRHEGRNLYVRICEVTERNPAAS